MMVREEIHSKNMGCQLFIPEQGIFSICLPSSWTRYEDKEGTYVFFDSTNWSGNFRITPLLFEKSNKNERVAYLENIFQKNKQKDAARIIIKENQCITFKDSIDYEENEELVIYYWFLQKEDFVFAFSFAIEKTMDFTEKNSLELEKVVEAIHTLNIIGFN